MLRRLAKISGLLGLIMTALLPSTQMLGQAADVVVETEENLYYQGEDAVIHVRGLQSCAGQTVRVGFFYFDVDTLVEIFGTTVLVNENGEATATLEVTVGGRVGPAGVAGDCVPGLYIEATEDTYLLYNEPTVPPRTTTPDTETPTATPSQPATPVVTPTTGTPSATPTRAVPLPPETGNGGPPTTGGHAGFTAVLALSGILLVTFGTGFATRARRH